jgi:hypothetical protein
LEPVQRLSTRDELASALKTALSLSLSEQKKKKQKQKKNSQVK